MALLIALLGTGAQAFRPPPPGAAWPDEAYPVAVEVHGCPLEGTACLSAARAASDDWASIPCTDLSAAIVAAPAGTAPIFGDGINQLVFDDPDRVVTPGLVGQAFVSGDEVDFVVAAGVPFATHDDVLSGACYLQLDLRAFVTYALGRIFRLEPPRIDPYDREAFWRLPPCDPRSGILTAPLPEGALTVEPGFRVVCGPRSDGGLLLGRAPFEVSCDVLPDTSDVLFAGYDQVHWDLGDGAQAQGPSIRHTFVDGGVHQIQAGIARDGERCDPLRGTRGPAATVCGPLAPDLEVEPRGRRAVKIRNHRPPGGPGCEVEASWTVLEIGGDGVPVAESTAWSPVFELPGGTYEARVDVTATEGATSSDRVTFALEGGLACATGPARPARLGLVAALALLLLGLRRVRPVVRVA